MWMGLWAVLGGMLDGRAGWTGRERACVDKVCALRGGRCGGFFT